METLKKIQSSARIIEVQSDADWRLFHRVPHRIYRHDPNWIAPLESDIRSIFDPRYNSINRTGASKQFVLVNGAGQPVGRIAAFVDRERNSKLDYPVGGIGFFDCLNDRELAFQLFSVAEDYLADEGVKAIDGPINFGERDKFWGLLVKGFQPPLYQENYNPTYYEPFFTAWGFRPYEQVLTLRACVRDVPMERFANLAERVRRQHNLTTRMLEKNNLPLFARHFSAVYNAAFKQNPYYKHLSAEQVLEVMKAARPVVDPKMVAFAYEGKKPIGFCAFLPDINPFLRPAKGRLTPIKLPFFLYRLKTARKLQGKGMAFGIDPQYQKKGVFSVLVDALSKSPTLQRYTDVYLATIRGHNKLMLKTTKNLGTTIDRVHIAYRKLLDDTLPFERFEFTDTEEPRATLIS